MATTYTTNYHLGKQTDHSDKFDMAVITDNMDTIDEALAAKQDTLAFEGTYNASTNKAATMSAVKDGKLTGYAQASGDVAATDKIIEAIGKVEKKADDNKNNISITDITSTFTAGENITIDNRSKVYMQNKHIFGTLILQSTTDFSSTAQTVISTMTYPPATATICGGFLSDTGWSVKGVAYVYTGSAWSVRVDTSVTGCAYVIIPVDYMTT